MNRLAQASVLTAVIGSVVMFIGLFPDAMGIDNTPGIGLAQVVTTLTGLILLTTSAYVFTYAMVHRGREVTLSQDIGVRMGLSGLTFAIAAGLADVLGFGSHSLYGGGVSVGQLQATGMVIGFLIAALGVLIYGMRR